MTGRMVIVVALLASCSSSSKDAGSDKPGKSSKDQPTGDVALLFTGKSAQLPTEIEKAKFGEGKADTFKATGADATYFSSKAAAGVSYDLNFDKAGKLTQIRVAAGKELEPLLAKQWGTPIKTKKGEAFWFSPDTGLRAWLPAHAKGKAVTFSPYEPVTKLLGDKGFTLAFAKDKPLFGATVEELKAAWGTALCDYERQAPKIKDTLEKNAKDSLYRVEPSQMQLRWCPSTPRTVEQYTPSADTIYIGRDGKANQIVLSIPLAGSPELQQQVLDELDAKFGKPEEVKKGTDLARHYFDPATKMRAIARAGDQSVALWVGPYLPVAELVGGDKPGLSVETASMPGGTFEQIAKEDPVHFHQHGTLASLFFPPTEYGSYTTEVTLDFYDKEKNTYGYTVVVHFEDHEAAGDEIMKLLEAKFGAGKKDAKSKDGDVTYHFAKAGRKLAARRVQQQWQLRVTK